MLADEVVLDDADAGLQRGDQPRAARRDRQHLGLELPVLRRAPTCSCPPCWPATRCSTSRRSSPRAPGRPIAEHAARRGRARRRVHRWSIGGGRRRRRAAGPADRRRVLHRLVRHRQAHRRGRGRSDDPGAARAGRQGPRLRLRRRRRAAAAAGLGRRRVLQQRPELLLGRADLRARAVSRRRSSTPS